MRKLLLLQPLLLIAFVQLFAQNPKIDHWELISNPEKETIKYFVGKSQAPINWNAADFDDAEWLDFPMYGIGYGDFFGDDELGLSAGNSIYTRSVFSITDTSVIESIMLQMYYADGFVAYINGIEVARENLGLPGEFVAFDQYADTTHPNNAGVEYGNFTPGYLVDKEALNACLVSGNNVLSVEIHNDKYLTESLNYFLLMMVGLKTDGEQYFGRESFLPIKVNHNIDSLTLPVLNIQTPLEIVIPNEPKLSAKMQVVYSPNNSLLPVSSTLTTFNGDIGIELRGSSSLSFYPKKSYTIETRDSAGNDLAVSLLGMPAESDWVLYAPYGDKTLLRNVLTYNLSNSIGKYAPRTQFVELVLNNDYMGTYVLVEKIKRDKNRVDVSKLRADELAGDSLTGGYIIKIDKREGNYDGWRSSYGSAEKPMNKYFYQYVYPKYDEIKEEQKDYIQEFMLRFEHSLRIDDFESVDVGYQKYLDTESFIDYLIMNELTKNMDGYRLSTFMYKDKDSKGGKLHMGPVWDYNLALGNYSNFGGTQTSGWALDFGKVATSDPFQVPFWWDRLLQDERFVNQLIIRWKALRERELSQQAIFERIDSMVQYTSVSRVNNFAVWNSVFDLPIWPNNQPFADDYLGEVAYLKNWIADRLIWIDNNIDEVRQKAVYVSIHDNVFTEYVGVKAYPNPFNNYIAFNIELEANHQVSISIFNAVGQKVKDLEYGILTNGSHKYEWNGTDNNGQNLVSGMYMYRVSVDGVPLYKGRVIKE